MAWAGYILVVAAGVVRHEPWSDEAQSWLLARDASPGQLFTELLRSEGSPGLWHAILLVPAKLGLPYFTVNVIAALVGATAAFLVFRHSPFPLPVKLLLPFSFFLSYQYAVVGRNYALLPPVIFGIALAYPSRDTRPFRFALLLALLANVSAQGFLFAGCLAAIHAARLLKNRSGFGGRLLMRHTGALAGLGLVMGLVVLQLINSKNVHFTNKPFRLDGKVFESISWILLRESMTGSKWLTLMVVAISVWWFWRTKVLHLYLLPTFVLFVFASSVYSNAWHEGIPFLAWVLPLWVSLQPTELEAAAGTEQPGARPAALDQWSRRAVLGATFLVIVVQIGWAVNAFRFDLTEPYSGSRAAAAFVKQNDLHEQVIYGMDFPSIALLPYFESNIYDNLNKGRNPSFWDWTSPMTTMTDRETALKQRPDVVVQAVNTFFLNEAENSFPEYRPVACFPGAVSWKYGPREAEAFLIFIRESAATLPRFVPKTGPLSQSGCTVAS